MNSPTENCYKSISLQGRTESSPWNSLIMNYRLMRLVATQRAVAWSSRAPVPQQHFGLTSLCTTLHFICKLVQLCSSAYTCVLTTWSNYCEIVSLAWNTFFQCTHRTILTSQGIFYMQSRTELHFFFFMWSMLIQGIKDLSAELWI